MWKDATEQAEAIRSGQISAEELVKDSITKIEEGNKELNAVVSTQFEEALKKVKKIDGSQPFSGVPILLKDLGQNQAGQLSTSGSKLFATYRALQDDNYTKRVEKLGFIVLGRTNTPEFGFKNISDGQLHGSVNLPKDNSRNAGGSSGGSASAVAAGMVAVAGASDGGGSIRIPASFNGLIGLKPTRGRLPVGPGSFRSWQGASSHFFLTKSVRDTRALLAGMQTCQLDSPFPLPELSYNVLFKKKVEPLTIAYRLESPIESLVSEEAKQAVLQMVAQLSQLGHKLVPLEKNLINGIEAMKSYYIMNSVETAQLFDGVEKSLGRSMTLEDMELMTWAIFRSGQTIPAKLYSQVLHDWDYYSAVMHDFHQNYDLLLTPTVASTAPKHGQFDLTDEQKDHLKKIDSFSMLDQQDLIWDMFKDSLAWTPFTQFQNLTGQPAISLPTFETTEGLPIGVQLTAAKGREDLLLAVADQLEAQSLLIT